MPIFEYQCRNPLCTHVFEVLVIGGGGHFDCPKCGTGSRRIMSTVNAKINGKYTAKTGYAYESQNRPLPTSDKEV